MSAKNVEDFYPLSPMQQGMLFHSLYAPESGVYVEQVSCVLRGSLDAPAFERAWQRVVERYAILRTAFVGEGLKELVQVVQRRVQLPLELEDWRGLPAAEQDVRLEGFLQEERRRGFKLSQAPLMRLALMRTAAHAHCFVWSYHHALLDGWSIPLLLQEVFAFYAAFCNGQDVRLPPPRPYRDYIVWLKCQDAAEAEAAWREMLQGFTTPTPLVVNRHVMLSASEASLASETSRASEASHGGHSDMPYSQKETWLSAAATTALQALAREHGLTLNTLVQAAWALLLSRYSGEEDVLFGATVSGRPPDLAGSELMVGLFINTLPVRVRVPVHSLLLPWLKDLQAQQARLRQYEYSPLVQVQGWSQVPRGTPLFESILVFENYPISTSLQSDEGSLTIENVQSVEQTNYPITVVAGLAQTLMLKIVYECAQFDTPTIGRMLGHLATLLHEMALDPGRPLSGLPMLTEAEQHQPLVAWNATQSDYPHSQCVHQLFEAQVERTPDAIAVTCAGEHVTYRELNRRANQLAHRLQKLGVGPDSLVGLCTERSAGMVVGAVAALKAGGAYLALDPAYAQHTGRLAFMLEDAQVAVLLTQVHLHPSLPAVQAQEITMDTDREAIDRESDDQPQCAAGVENLAYAIYTSGSTGRPKGVPIEHQGLLNLIFWHRRTFAVSQSDRAAQLAGPGFDASVWEIWPYLTAGASVHVVPDDIRVSPWELQDWLLSESITIAFLPTPLAERVLCLPWPEEVALRTLLTGGDKLHHYAPPALPFELVNNYGPTEDTVVTTSGIVPIQERADMAPPIGRPIANTQVYLLDPHFHPVPVGVPGELYVGGVGLSRGYLGRPELTAERFIPNPFTSLPSPPTPSPIIGRGGPGVRALGDEGARLYKTGDLARYLPDGQIEFLGRIDHQVKIRGFRVELGEIEVVLGEHPAVQDAVVLAREREPGDKWLVAYVVPAQPTPLAPADLRDFLQERLPAYMVPAAFVMLDTMPLTPNGKVDRKALPTPDGGQASVGRTYVAPYTSTQEILANLWSQLLGTDRIGAYDNFFELGGHSLLATQLMSRVRKTFDVELPLRVLFETRTLAELAERFESARQAATGLSAPPIEPVARDGEIPLSFAQQRLWFLDQLEPDSPFYNIPTAVRLTGRLDTTALERSLNEIVRRHEALRTTFQTIDGRPAQSIAPDLTLPLPIVDLTALPEAEREGEAMHWAMDETQRPFDLAQGPLLRAHLLKLDERDHVAVLTMHHIISDGWSMGILVQELGALYDAFSNGIPSPLPELPIQYADFAHWQRRWLQGNVLETQLDYWRQQLAGSPSLLELPTDRPRPPIQTWRGATATFTIPPDVSEKLRALTRQEGVTLFMALLAAFQTLLHRITGQPDISVGTPIANRNRAEIEGLIGFFVNTLVMRSDLSDDPNFRQLLKRVRQVALEAYTHQDLPFEMLVDALQPERDLSHTPLFQVMFTLQSRSVQNGPRDALELSDLTLSPVNVVTGTANFDLILSIAEGPDTLAGEIEYKTDLFETATIQRLAGHFQVLLEGIVRNPERPISMLPVLTEGERHQLLVEWNDTATPYPHDKCIHRLFEAQVGRTPDANAVSFEEERVTYAELNRRANQVAHYLQKLGAGPDTLVGICVERSPEMIVGLWGVLKAGAGYLPLDPTYPQERQAFMLEDAGVPVLLTQERLLQHLPSTKAQIICLDTNWQAIAQERIENPASSATADNLAYVIYTSGSTGKPKGVMVSHRNLVHSIIARLNYYHEPVHSFLLLSSFAFDSSIVGIFGTLCQGGILVLTPQGIEKDLMQLIDRIEQHCVTETVSLASQYALFLAHAEPRQLASLRMIMLGGEACPRELPARHMERLARATLYNEYGPTEGTVWASVYKVGPRHLGAQVPIGRPISDMQIYILDAHQQLVPIGVPGELCIGGEGIARGYLNRPELTAERFIPDPFGRKPGAHLYRTGDLAHYLPDGNIEFLGRVDHQVKVRGFRIELGEIEAVLEQHPGLQQAVALVREDSPGNQRLVAYVVPGHVPAPTVSQMRNFLKDKLPEYMLPSNFIVMDALPCLPNGKVNRHALPVPDSDRPELESVYVAPRTQAEEILASIWIQVLGVERVGVHDNFFELGGDSILSIQVIARANQAGLHLTPKHLFQSPTIAYLARAASTGTVIQAEQEIVTGPVPLTPIQHWFFEHHPREPHHWNTSMLIQVWQELDVSLLEEAIRHLAVHHDALRLRFQKSEVGWEQFDAAVEEVLPFSVMDLSMVAPAEQCKAIEMAAAAMQASLNLSTGPLFRVAYFDLGPDQPRRLLMVFHHLVMDGVSWRIFLEDLQTVYYQLKQGDLVRLPAKTTSFRYWSHRLSEYAQAPEVRQELDYWQELGRKKVTALPVDFPDGANTYGSVEQVTVSLGGEETSALLQRVPAVYGTQVSDVLLTALTRAFAHWTGERALLVELEGHGREHVVEDVDLSRTLGWFTTSFPVLLELGNSGGLTEALQMIKEQVHSIPRRGIGYGLLRYLSEDTQVGEQLRALPEPEVSFNYLGQFDYLPTAQWFPFQIAPESVGPEQSPEGTRTVLLYIVAITTGGELGLRCLYSRHQYQRCTIERLMSDFVQELRFIVDSCRGGRDDLRTERFARGANHGL